MDRDDEAEEHDHAKRRHAGLTVPPRDEWPEHDERGDEPGHRPDCRKVVPDAAAVGDLLVERSRSLPIDPPTDGDRQPCGEDVRDDEIGEQAVAAGDDRDEQVGEDHECDADLQDARHDPFARRGEEVEQPDEVAFQVDDDVAAHRAKPARRSAARANTIVRRRSTGERS